MYKCSMFFSDRPQRSYGPKTLDLEIYTTGISLTKKISRRYNGQVETFPLSGPTMDIILTNSEMCYYYYKSDIYPT